VQVQVSGPTPKSDDDEEQNGWENGWENECEVVVEESGRLSLVACSCQTDSCSLPEAAYALHNYCK